MTRHTLAISLLVLPSLLACPDPPAEILGAAEISTKTANGQAQPVNQGGPQGDPSAMDLSPGGTLLLDLAAAVPQHTQAQLKASTEPMVTIAGTLQGSCEGGAIRIDVIEVGISHTDSGPMVGPITALLPEGPGDYSLLAPSGRTYQIAALCDIDKDNKIVQNKDKLAPGIALGEVTEDKIGIDLAFSGEDDTPVNVGGQAQADAPPPGDKDASIPSAQAGARDRKEDAPTTEDTEDTEDTD